MTIFRHTIRVQDNRVLQYGNALFIAGDFRWSNWTIARRLTYDRRGFWYYYGDLEFATNYKLLQGSYELGNQCDVSRLQWDEGCNISLDSVVQLKSSY